MRNEATKEQWRAAVVRVLKTRRGHRAGVWHTPSGRHCVDVRVGVAGLEIRACGFWHAIEDDSARFHDGAGQRVPVPSMPAAADCTLGCE